MEYTNKYNQKQIQKENDEMLTKKMKEKMTHRDVMDQIDNKQYQKKLMQL